MTLTLDLESPGAPTARVERRFLGWSGPFLPIVAAELAREHASEGRLAMGDALVVVPGARAGRRLKEVLLSRAEDAGVRLVPPRIVTVGELPELLYAPALPLASEALCRRAWVMALRGLPASRLAVLVPAGPPAAGDLVGWTRLAATVEALHREVSGGGVSFAAVAAHCEEGLLFSDVERWAVFAEAQAAYAGLLRSLGAEDPGLARIAAVPGARDADVWLVGVVEMPRVVSRMVASVAASGARVRALVHAPPTEADAFDELGCVVPAAWARRPVPLSDDVLAVTGRPADQADEVVRTLAGLGGRFAPEEIVVAVPDEEVLPHLEQRLVSAGVPARRATGARVTRTAAPRFLSALADYLDGNRYDACAALARHPDLWQWIRKARGSADSTDGRSLAAAGAWIVPLDKHFSRRLPIRLRPRGVEGTHWTAAAVGAFCRVLDDEKFLGRLSGTGLISGWMPKILDLLLEVYGDEPLDRMVPDQRELLDALSKLKDAAAALHRLPVAADERCDGATAIRLLLDAASGQTLTPRADDAAVELLGWLEIHLDDAPVTVVTGLNEGILPESVNAHAHLPDALRGRLGIVDNASRYARDAYQLTALIGSGRELKVIAGRHTVRGDPLRPSRLMFAVEGRAVAERVRRFYGDAAGDPGTATSAGAATDAKTAASPERAARGAAGSTPEVAVPSPSGGGSCLGASGAEPPSGFQLPPEPVLTVRSPIDHLSVSRFGAVLHDPYVFALETVLRLRALDDDATELDGPGFGNLAHHVLERFGRTPGAASSIDAAEIARALDGILNDALAEGFGGDSLPAVRFQAEQLRARLHGFAVWQAGWSAAGWRIVGVECRTPEGGVPLFVDGEPFGVTGRIDRIDYHPELDEWAIFDYKSGDAGDPPDRTHRHGRGGDRTWKDLQLPLYRHILPHVVDADGRSPFTGADAGGARLGYILLPRDVTAVGASFAEWTADELAEADEAAHEVVRFLREGTFRWNASTARPPRDPRLAALLGLGYLEIAVEADEEIAHVP